MAPIVNIAAYRFVPLDDLPARREALHALASRSRLKGTILLAPEGINLFLAGTRGQVDTFLTQLRLDPAFAPLEVKESLSEAVPFAELFVKLKREIIACGVDAADPTAHPRGPAISPQELKARLDRGEELLLLDTRNAFEVEFGTFAQAEHLHLKHFRDFASAVEQLPRAMRSREVVIFCTGGIRCEKASLLMQQAGFGRVRQLEGGILKYFEEVGGDHWQGDCFVFDGRVALTPSLQPIAPQDVPTHMPEGAGDDAA